MKSASTRTLRILGTLGLVGAYGALSLGSEGTSAAKPKISGFQCEADVRFVNGEPDAGVKVTFVATNEGDAGPIELIPHISTSEGEWKRDQTLRFDAGETKSLTYFFQEPSINAENVQCGVRTIPD
jgi:hypothetical protein